MQMIDTFSGIGGFSLAGRWMGWETVQFCEIDPFCQKVLSYHWPEVPIHDDIKTLTADMIRQNGLYDESETTIFVGGVPCQPWSSAGKRLGREDDRDLWAETIALIGQIKPSWAVLENVSGLLSWNEGVVFEEVQTDLEAEGYEVQAFVLPAAGVGAPHRRDRVWIVGYSGSKQFQKWTSFRNGQDKKKKRTGVDYRSERSGDIRFAPNTSSDRRDRQGSGFETEKGLQQRPGTTGRYEQPAGCFFAGWENFPTKPPVRCRNDGFPTRLDGITFSKWRNESIKGFGNAIVPAVALQIFKAIEQMEK